MLRNAARIRRTYRHLQRFRDIVRVFLKYGYDDVAHRLHLPSLLDLGPVARPDGSQALTPAERFRRACEELGPTFVKLGQLLSTRPDLVPPGFAEELAALQDSALPMPFGEVRRVLEEDLPGGIPAHFASLDEEPLGSASMAQVHRATLKGGGRAVVKVQRPGIPRIIEVDLEILEQVAGLMEEHLPAWRPHRPALVVAELSRKLSAELDFGREAGNAERFATQFAGDPTVRVPAVFRDSSTPRVLTMEEIEGVKAPLVASGEAPGLDRIAVARRLSNLVIRQIFEHGFFHADPHPGNIVILPGNVVCFLDFGQMGYLDSVEREDFAALLWGVARRNPAQVAHALARLGSLEGNVPPGLESDAGDFMHQHFYHPLGQLRFGALVSHLLDIAARHRLRLPPDFFVMLKALSQAEGLVRKLDGKRNLLRQAAPVVRRARLERFQPKRVAEELLEAGIQFGTFARDLPGEVRRIISQLKGGEIRIVFHHDGLEPMTRSLDQVSNRLSFALVLAAMLIGSSLMVHADIPPRLAGIPIIGLAGFLMAGMMGFWLLISILRHGRF